MMTKRFIFLWVLAWALPHTAKAGWIYDWTLGWVRSGSTQEAMPSGPPPAGMNVARVEGGTISGLNGAQGIAATVGHLPGVYSQNRGEQIQRNLGQDLRSIEERKAQLESFKEAREKEFASYFQNTLSPQAAEQRRRLTEISEQIDRVLGEKLPEIANLSPNAKSEETKPEINKFEQNIPREQLNFYKNWDELETLYRAYHGSSNSAGDFSGGGEQQELDTLYHHYFNSEGLLKGDLTQNLGISLSTPPHQPEGKAVREQINHALAHYYFRTQDESKSDLLPRVRFAVALAQEADYAFKNGERNLGLSYLSLSERANSNPHDRSLQSGKAVIAYAQLRNREVEQKVASIGEQIGHIAPRFDPGALEFLQQYLSDSQASSQEGLRIAQQGATRSTVQLLSDFAVDTLNSIGSFMGGVESGVRDGFVSAASLAQAIFNDPVLISNLTNNIKYTLSAGPQGMGTVFSRTYRGISDVIYHHSFIMWHGNAYEKGHAIGNLGAVTFQALVAAEGVKAGKVALLKVAKQVVQSGASQKLGQVLTRKVLSPTVYASLAPSFRGYVSKAWNYSGRFWRGTLKGGEGAGKAADSAGGSTIGTDCPFNLNRTHRIQTGNLKRVGESIQRDGGIRETIKYVEHEGRRYIVDGNHRARAAMEMGIQEVPVERVELPYRGYKSVNDLLNR